MEYSIISAGAEHVPLLGAIEKAAATRFPAGSIPDAIRSDETPAALLEEGVREGALWVALEGCGRPVGYALLRFVAGHALLAQMDVVPEHGRRGIGRRLVSLVAQRARECGHDVLFLTTFTHVPWNAPFYARLGFTPIAEGEALPFMREILAGERAHGLAHRVAMQLPLRG